MSTSAPSAASRVQRALGRTPPKPVTYLPGTDVPLDWTAALADLPLIATVVLVASLALLLSIGREAAILLLLSNAGHFINSGVKEVVARPRPSAALVHVSGRESDFSFPSGHVESSIVLYGLIFYFATLYVAGAWQRRAVQTACIWLIAGTAIQRVYSGAHWPSDVFGGFYLGLLLLVICIAVHRLVILPRKE